MDGNDHVMQVEQETQVDNLLCWPNRFEGFDREAKELEGSEQEDHAIIAFLL